MRIFEQKPEQNIGLKPFLSLLMIAVFLMGFTFYKLEEPKNEAAQQKITESEQQLAEEQIPKDPSEQVLFKSEDSKLGVVLEMTKNTIIAKTENSKVKLYVNEKLYPLNQKIPFGEQDIATMLQLDENASYHFFSRQYFETHDRAKWEKENEDRNTYVFDKTTEFFTFQPANESHSEANNSDEERKEMLTGMPSRPEPISKVENKTAQLSEIKIPEPLQFHFEESNLEFRDTSNLEILKKLMQRFDSNENSEVKVRIDGESVEGSTSIEDALSVREIKSIRISMPSKESKNAVVDIYTKDIVGNKVGEILSQSENITINVQYKTAEGDFLDEKTMNVTRDNVTDVLKINNESFLYVIQGELKSPGYRPKDIDPNSIEKIIVLKGKNATSKYGKKAKNGAVEIYLKKE